jgi:ribonuclease III
LISKLLQKLRNKNSGLSKELLESVGMLESSLKYSFKDKALIVHALKHRSYTTEHSENRGMSNERLEFLGDAVLNFAVSKFLYKTYPDKPEGEMSKMRSILVSGESLKTTAKKLRIGKYLLLSEYETKSGGREKGSILEDCMEAVIGAIYLDGGIMKTLKFINESVLSDYESFLELRKNANYKSELLELVQSFGFDPPTYDIVSEEGPEHEKTFTVNVKIGISVLAEGRSSSRKKAEQEASCKALEIIKENPEFLGRIK